MIIEGMCRVADGPLWPGEREVTQAAVPLVSWSVDAREVPEGWELLGDDLPIELHFPDSTVWTGEAYPVADVGPGHQVPGQPPEQEFPLKVQLRGIGPLSENSVPVHADVVVARIQAMLGERQS